MQLGKEEGGMTEQPCPWQPCGMPAEGVPGQRFLLLSWFQCCGSVLTGGRGVKGSVVGRGMEEGSRLGWEHWGMLVPLIIPRFVEGVGSWG